MKKIYSLMLLCAAIVFATGCSKDDDTPPTPVSVSGVTLDKATLSIEVGKTATLTATVAPENATDKSVTWSSDKTDIATVKDGVVTAVAAGTATITVTTTDGKKTAACQVTVTAATIAVTSITLDGDKSILVGEKATPVATILPTDATNQTVTWSSSSTAVATIDATTGEVTAVAKGETTITATSASNPTVTATCKVTVEEKPADYIEVNGIKVSVGNLVADGANGAKVGTATDGGLFFQFGSLVGWSATDPLAVAVSPVGYTGGTSWNKDWTGDPTTDDAVSGTGDPCRYYLKGTWRLPTNDEYVALFKDGGYPSGTWKWENASATNSTKNLTFPASGYRNFNGGGLGGVGTYGYAWSASPVNASIGYNLGFNSSDVVPSDNNIRAVGLPVRCVK